MPLPRALALPPLLLAAALAGCGSVGGPASGPADTHCSTDAGVVVQAVSNQACQSPGGGGADEALTLYNGAGADDDCKYDVSLTTATVAKATDATLVVTLRRRTDHAAVTGAGTHAEVYLDATHPAPNAGTVTTEAPAGTYTLAPVRFDASGRWTVRLHFFESCADAPDSPHGHVAFFLDVP